MISSKVVACTSQPVAFSGHPSKHPSTSGRLTGLRNKVQQKQTCQHLAVVYWQLVSLLMELSINGENCYLTQCAQVAGFVKVDHIYITTTCLHTISHTCIIGCGAAAASDYPCLTTKLC